MTSIQKTIIIASIMSTILDEYEEDQITEGIQILKDQIYRFMLNRSGVEERVRTNKLRQRTIVNEVVDHKRHDEFKASIAIGERVWQKAVDHYAKNKIKFDAVHTIEALYGFDPDMMSKYAKIKQHMIDTYKSEGVSDNDRYCSNGTIVGGYLLELLYEEMGMKVNGRLRALKQKVERELGEVA